ncbi:hypothetical protein ONS96_001128 [Cadophora gregata f. sp. sojae]|nr:hypothetical protein ONS96_001128 [Cadophora gregata f. sp. sojae]
MKASMISVLAVVAAAQAGYVAYPEGYPVESTSTYEAPKPTYPASTSTYEAPKPTYPASSEKVYETASTEAPKPTYPASSSTAVPYTTSTVYETKEYTITSCAPTVTDCPVGHKTSTIITKTTVCPVEATKTPEAPEYPTKTPEAPEYPTKTPEAPEHPTYTPEGPVKPTYTPEVPVYSTKTNEGPVEYPTGKPSVSVPVAPYPTYPASTVGKLFSLTLKVEKNQAEKQV